MAKSFPLLEYFPDRWRELKEVKAICDSDVTSVDGDDRHTLQHLWKCMDAELNNAFILPYGDKEGADEYTCSRWESILGIVPADDMTLDDRQFNIYTKLFQSTPYTYRKLIEMMDYLVGETNYRMTRDVKAKTLQVKISIGSRFKAESVKELLDRIVPANVLLNIEIAYTTHNNMSAYTHNELSVYTHDEIKITQMYDTPE